MGYMHIPITCVGTSICLSIGIYMSFRSHSSYPTTSDSEVPFLILGKMVTD